MRKLPLLLLFTAAAFAQEIPVSDPTFESQAVESAQVAASGDRFITVWGRGGNSGVFASITDLNGTLLRGPVTLSLVGGLPAIAAGANGSFVAWLDGDSLHTALIDNDGKMNAPMLLAVQAGLEGPLSVTWNGSRFLVLTRTLASGLIGYLVDANGQRVSDALAIGQWISVVTADDDGFIVFASKNVDDAHPEKGSTIWGRRIESSGAMSPWTQTTSEVSFPRIAAVGRTLFWEYGGIPHRVVTDAFGVPVSQSIVTTGTLQLEKAIAIGSGELLHFAGTPQQWSLMLVSPDGSVIAQDLAPTNGVVSDLASIGTRALLVSSGEAGDALNGRLVDATTTIHTGDRINIGHTAVNQLFPQVASNGQLLLAVWMEPSTAQLFAARIDPRSGKHLDGRGILLDSHQYFAAPAVAPLGDGFVAAYLEVSSGVAHLWIRRVFPDGTLDASPTLVSTTAQPWAPRLASDGSQALLVWTENTYSVHGTRISRDGAIVDPAFLQISAGDSLALQFAPDVGLDGDNYLVAWQGQTTSGRTTQLGISAVHVTKSGVVLNPPTAVPMKYFPRVAANFVAAIGAPHVFVDPLGGTPIDLGDKIGLGDIEQFGGGMIVVGTTGDTSAPPTGLWAAQILDGQVVDRFDPRPVRATADQPSLTRTTTGVTLTYIRATGDEGFGGSMRAYALPITEGRRRPSLPAR